MVMVRNTTQSTKKISHQKNDTAAITWSPLFDDGPRAGG